MRKISSILVCLILIAGPVTVNFILARDSSALTFSRDNLEKLLANPVLTGGATAEAASRTNQIETSSTIKTDSLIMGDSNLLNPASPLLRKISPKTEGDPRVPATDWTQG